MTDNEYIEQFRREFGIHFSPSELQFAEVFIEEMVAKVQAQERERVKEWSWPKMSTDHEA